MITSTTAQSAAPLPWERIEALLHRVRKPGRYVGGEFNAVHKPWDATELHVCLAFPDLYDLGMSNYALRILYDRVNRRPEMLAERAYLPAPDMIAEMRAAELPLYTLESYRPVAAFDVLAISAAYEQLFTNALELMDLAGLPIRSADRTAEHPLVIGGGHGAFNPEPVTDFFDLFVIGEAEEALIELLEAFQHVHSEPREAQLRALLEIPGLYIPRFYRAAYQADHTLSAIEPTTPEAPLPIQRRIAPELPAPPIRQIVPNIDIVHNRAIVEIQRGCLRGCRFCQAGIITRPTRERSADDLVAEIAQVFDATGYEEMALLSLSAADHSEISELLDALQARFDDPPTTFSLPSLRIDSFSVELADALSGGRHSGFTFAPEAGTERLRRRINKEISDEQLLTIAKEVFARGWRTLKLYFMVGLPGETDEDIDALIELAHQVRRIGYHEGGRKTEAHVSVSTFVPKPQTPFQWEPLIDEATLAHRQEMLKQRLRGPGMRFSWNPYAGTRLEALLARGDRRLNAVVERAWRLGARFDAWEQWQEMAAWEQAIEEYALGPDSGRAPFGSADALLDFYLYRRRSEDETLPWDHLHSGVEKRFLQREYQRSQRGEFSPHCREQCLGCGIRRTYPTERREDWPCLT
jgi:radical SAM family uncharacterized protein